jgi:RND family efflux transporter MFP subunit
LGVLLLGIAAGVALYLLRPRPEPQQPGPQAPFVQTAPAEARMTPLIITGNGVVQPRAEIGLSTQVAGRVADMHPNLLSGGAFDAGEALIRLEDEDYVNAVRQARAAVAQRQVELQQAREEVRIAEQELENLRQRLDGLGSDPAGHAQVGPGQDSGLAADFDVPGQTAAGGRAADTADPPPDGGAPAPREDGAGGLAVSPLTLRRPQLEAAEAALAAARAQLADAELALARTTVTAPFAGQVRSENVDVGQFVQPGQELARIYSSDAVEVVVPLTSDEAALIPALWSLPAGGGGTSVDAEVSAEFGGRRFAWRGYVDRAKGFIDPQSRTVDVVVRVPEPFRTDPPAAEDAPAQRPPLLIGTYTTVRIQGQQPGRYLAIPASALHDGDRVWILSPMETDGDERMRLEVRPVTVILRDDQRVFVTAPEIADGTLLVTTDLAAVTDGMAVRTRATPAETP